MHVPKGLSPPFGKHNFEAHIAGSSTGQDEPLSKLPSGLHVKVPLLSGAHP
jgi:hypothetical protein